MTGMKTEMICILAVAAILVMGWWSEQRLEAVIAAALVPTVMGLAHWGICWRARGLMEEDRAKMDARREQRKDRLRKLEAMGYGSEK